MSFEVRGLAWPIRSTKPPLEPTGTITAFLTCSRLDQAQDLSAEILAPVRPAQPAARDLAAAQVHALDPR